MSTRALLRDYFFLPTERLLSGACVNADAATLFTLLDVLGLRKSLDAFEATRFEVFSIFAMQSTPKPKDTKYYTIKKVNVKGGLIPIVPGVAGPLRHQHVGDELDAGIGERQ